MALDVVFASMSEPNRHATRADVVRSYTTTKAWSELSGELPAHLLYRPVSFWITVPLLRFGVRASSVTAFSGLLALLLPVLTLVAPAASAYALVGIVALAFHVLDCVDGNLARTTGTSSPFGAFFDGIVDATFWTALFVSMGIVVQRGGGWLSRGALSIALACGLLVLLGRRIRDEYRERFGARAVLPERRPVHLRAGTIALFAFAGLENVYAIAWLVAGALGYLDAALLGIATYVLAVFAVSLVTTVSAAWRAR